MALTYKYDRDNKPYAIDATAELENKFVDPQYALSYLNEVLEDGEYELFFDAIGSIAKLHGVRELSEKIGLNREALYRALSTKGNPSFKSTIEILGALGIELAAQYKDSNRNACYENVTSNPRVYLLHTVVDHEEGHALSSTLWPKVRGVSSNNVISIEVGSSKASADIPREFTAAVSPEMPVANQDLALAA